MHRTGTLILVLFQTVTVQQRVEGKSFRFLVPQSLRQREMRVHFHQRSLRLHVVTSRGRCLFTTCSHQGAVLGCVAGALSYAELGTHIPLSGAEFSYLHHAYGGLHRVVGPLPAFLFSWINMVLHAYLKHTHTHTHTHTHRVMLPAPRVRRAA